MQCPAFFRYLVPPRSKYSPQHHILKRPQLPFLPHCQRPSFTPTSLYKTPGGVISNRKCIKYVLVSAFTRIIFCQLKFRRKDRHRHDDLYTCLVPMGPRILFVGCWYVCLDGRSPLRGVFLHSMHAFINASSGFRTTILASERQKASEDVLNRILHLKYVTLTVKLSVYCTCGA